MSRIYHALGQYVFNGLATEQVLVEVQKKQQQTFIK